MELDHGTCKKTKFEPTDYISNMPENVITNILDRLPIQEAVRTSILSRSWRFGWTTLTQLVFDKEFIKYLLSKNMVRLFYRKNLYQILLQHRGTLMKFVLYIPSKWEIGIQTKAYDLMYADIIEGINHWIRCLSTKGLKEFVLRNMHATPLKLPTHIFSCLELKHLYLYYCCLHFLPGWHGFQDLLEFGFEHVTIEGCRYGEFVTCCPLLETLEYTLNNIDEYDMKLVEIGRLENLRKLFLSFSAIEDDAITSSNFFRCMGFLTKLEELLLDFEGCKSLVEEVGGRKTSLLPCLKTLTLTEMSLSNQTWMSCVCGLINGSPILQTLKIIHVMDEDKASTVEVDFDIRGNLQLRKVMLSPIRGSKNEICFVKSLLASSPLLEKMEIVKSKYVDKTHWSMFVEKLLKLPRASPNAEIELY